MSSGTNKERIVQNSSLIETNNERIHNLSAKVNELSGLSKNEYNACMEIADSIEVGIDYSNTTATAYDIRQGKIAYANGERLIGAMLDTNTVISADDTEKFTVSSGIKAIEKIDLPETCTNLEEAFLNLSSIKKLPEMDTSKVKTFSKICSGCKSIEDVSSLDMTQSVLATSAFKDCSKLGGELSFTMPNVTSVNYMFQNCAELEKVTLNNVSKCTGFQYTFDGCSKLKSVGEIDNNTNCYNYEYTFRNCENLEEAPFKRNPSTTANATSMFENCKKLKTVPFTITMGSNGTGYGHKSNMFKSCTSIKTAKIDATSYASGGYYYGDGSLMGCFSGCTSLETVEMPAKDRRLSSNMSSMFSGCTSLKNIVMCVTTATGSSFGLMFNDCSSLESVTDWTIWSDVTSSQSIFKNCTSLTTVEIDFKKSAILDKWFEGCTGLKAIPQCIIDATTSITLNYTFLNCTGLTALPEDLLKNINLKNLAGAFQGCTGLVTVPQYDFSRMTSIGYCSNMFKDCTALSDESLNNILASLATVGVTATTNKTLKYVGLSAEQATKCQSLSNYQAFVNAGWTTGY